VSDFHLGGGQTGTEVIAAVRQLLNKNTKAVLVTGDTSSAIRDLRSDSQLRITSKPINADEMLALIKELLAS
jgi:predicted MPP superfamily phosphohydrolase